MEPVNIFYSYAHQDEAYRDELSNYLGVLVKNGKIREWHDRKIEPGIDFNIEIENKIESSQIIIFLITENFLNSDYCFGIEVKKAFILQVQGRIKIVPVLVKPCLFDESRFSQLQIIPRHAQPISTSASREAAFNEVAKEIRDIVAEVLDSVPTQKIEVDDSKGHPDSLNIVRQQVTSYALLYERTRQLMRPGKERTIKMQAVFDDMKKIATSSFPFLEEFIKSPLPGERLAAISILQNFTSEQYFSFLVDTIGSEKPFVGYQAAVALRFAVNAVNSENYSSLLAAIISAEKKLTGTEVSFDNNRYKILQEAEGQLIFNRENLIGS